MYLLLGMFALANAGVLKLEQPRDLAKFNFSAGGVRDTICPDKSRCPGTDTCCPTTHGISCCQFVGATCCNDGNHCCPKGTVCNGSKCTKANEQEVTAWSENVMLRLKETVVVGEPNDICPDRSHCAGDHACCQNAAGGFSCCPYAGGTCCNDAQHCCPHGYVCRGTACVHTGGQDHADTMSEVAMLPTRDSSVEVSPNTICPDRSHCPGTDTCCSATHGYACCPHVDATCCNDGTHCCPSGHICYGIHCIRTTDEIKVSTELMTMRTENMVHKRSNNICPDRSRCPGDHTCCPTTHGWACCAYVGATCCNDAKHCCPQGCVCQGGTHCLQTGSMQNHTLS